MRLSPNPATGVLRIDAPGNGVSSLYDAAGKLMLQSSEKALDISALPAGSYLLEYSAGAGKSSATFIKD